MIKAFLPKREEVPEFYGITIHYIMGKAEEFEVAQHRVMPESQMLELVTKDDRWHLIGLGNIKRIEFDKSFSKIVAYKEEKNAEDAKG